MSAGYTCVVTGHSPTVPFNVLNDDLARFTQPTVQDLLECAAERHNVVCGCKIRIGGRVWLTSIPLSEADNCEWATVGHDPLPVNTSLRALSAAADTSIVQFVIAGEQTFSIDFLRLYREKLFTPYRVEGAAAYKRFGASSVLIPEKGTSFASMCSTPGSVFVDKTRSLLAMFQLSLSDVNIIRRPKGFGKSTFLSMFDAFFDPLSAHAHFPFTFTEDMSVYILNQQNQLPVIALDFADLSFDDTMGRGALEAECDRLLDKAAEKFFARYQSILGVSEGKAPPPPISPTFLDILGWAYQTEWKLCFTIDNYTAPFVNGPAPEYRHAILNHIFERLENLMTSDLILFGLIVGEDVPYCSDWDDMPRLFADISDSPAFFDAIGFTAAEVEALGRAVSVDLIGALQSYSLTSSRTDTISVYSASDVSSLAQHMLHPDGQYHAPLEVRTFAPDIPAKLEGHNAVESDDVAMRDGDYVVEPCRFFDDDYKCSEDDYECSEDGSYIRTPAMTTASSSSGSSSTSPSGSSSKSPGKQLSFTIAEEPSSPLEAYGKKPWDSDEL